MQLTAKLTQPLSMQTGSGKNGESKKMTSLLKHIVNIPKMYTSQFRHSE